jgi:hypothetical protein
LSHYNKYTDIFEYDDVPEDERKEVAQSVANWVMNNLNSPSVGSASSCASLDDKNSGCCGQ